MISSRALLLTLVVLNLLALAWWTGALTPLSGSVLEPQRLERQIQPERLRVLTAAETAQAEQDEALSESPRRVAGMIEQAPGERASPGAQASVSDQLTAGPMAMVADNPVATPEPSVARPGCMAFDEMNYPQYQRMSAKFRSAGLEAVGERTDSGRYLVYLGPLASAEAADARAETLRAQGVSDLHVIRSGQLRNSISLGLLPSRELALRQRDLMQRRGVGELSIGPLDPLGSRYRLQVTGPAAQISEALRTLEPGGHYNTAACR